MGDKLVGRDLQAEVVAYQYRQEFGVHCVRGLRYLMFISRGPWEGDHHGGLRLQVVH